MTTEPPSFPQNLDAERALLGAILVNNKAYDNVSDFLKPEHFGKSDHAQIFGACRQLIETGRIADQKTILDHFAYSNSPTSLKNVEFISEIHEKAVSAPMVKEIGHIILDLYLARELIKLSSFIDKEARSSKTPFGSMRLIEAAEMHLWELAGTGEIDNSFLSFKEAMCRALVLAENAHTHRDDHNATGLETGLRNLDRALGGLYCSDLIVIAAPPKMGTTALCEQIAFKAADTFEKSNGGQGAITAYFSLGVPAEQVVAQIASVRTGCHWSAISQGRLCEDEIERLVIEGQKLHQLPLYVDDTAALSLTALHTHARRLKRRHGLGLLIVDNIHRLAPNLTIRSEEQKPQIYLDISRSLKDLAKDLNIPVIAVCQTPIRPYNWERRSPKVSNLGKASPIEKFADVIVFLHRDAYYLECMEPIKHEYEYMCDFMDRHDVWNKEMQESADQADIIIAKQRRGPLSSIRVTYNAHKRRFLDDDGDFSSEELP